MEQRRPEQAEHDGQGSGPRAATLAQAVAAWVAHRRSLAGQRPQVEEPVTSPWRAAALLGAAATGLALLGIWTRPTGLLAAFWPANPVLAGLLVRTPAFRRWAPLVAMVVGFIAADLLTGADLTKATTLTVGNLAYIGVLVACYRWADRDELRLRTPSGVGMLLGACLAASVASALVGRTLINRVLHDPVQLSVGGWVSAELANGIGILPLVLSAPSLRRIRQIPTRPRRRPSTILGPMLALAVALVLATVVEGVLAVAVVFPVLVWASLRTRVFETSALVVASTAFLMMGIANGTVDLTDDGQDLTFGETASVQLSIGLLSLGPIATACTTAVREEELYQARRRAETDGLTGAMSRRAFQERAAAELSVLATTARPVVVAMLDLDRFKQINDSCGHAVGDRVLAVVADEIASALRDTDLFGRLGGDEFALLLPGMSPNSGALLLERIRAAVAAAQVPGFDGGVRISIGAVAASQAPDLLDAALALADASLYEAKRNRDQVVVRTV